MGRNTPEYMKDWAVKNPDKRAANDLKYRQTHRVEQAAKSRAYYHAHKDECRLRAAIYRKENLKKVYASKAIYVSKNKLHLDETKRLGRTRLLEVKAGRPCPSVCEICWRPPDKSSKRLDFDHNHATNMFRGWICGHCNTALGMAQDSPTLLRAMADYLERSKVLDG